MIRIRPFRGGDEQEILKWCPDEDTFYKWSFGVLGEFPLTGEKFAKTEKYSRFTAIDGSDVVGFFTVRNPGQRLEELRFGFVIVDPARRGQGIGKTMLRQGLSYAFTIYQAKRVSLGVFEQNRPAFACYSAIGFTRTGETETYSIRGEELEVIEMAVDRI
ncbi:MAG: GNAT family N-acetyltransferase [Firmicutes bacterium]|nr:GNAT family N-acetyltransferase [Bacillota bacterium]MBQ9016593.1 GNAT family N-acetyltransferase [Bacillota bacterium]